MKFISLLIRCFHFFFAMLTFLLIGVGNKLVILAWRLQENAHTCCLLLFCSSLSDSARACAKARSSSSCVVGGGLGDFVFD